MSHHTAAELKAQGNAAFKAKKYDAALSHYSAAIAKDDTDPTFFANRAAVLIHLDRHVDAVADCKKATQLKPGYTRAWSRMASAQTTLGWFEEAEASFRQAAAHSTGADHIKFEGLAKRSHRSAAGLRVALDSVRSHLPLHHLTEAADEESKSVASTAAAVLPMFEAHLKEAPRGLNVRIGYARALHRAGKFVLAMRVAAEAAKMDASNTDARFILGWCQLSQGHFPLALSSFQDALRRDPDVHAVSMAVKHCRALIAAKEEATKLYRAGSFREAVAGYSEAVALSKKFLPLGVAALHTNVAAARMALNDYTGAVDACGEAIRASPYFARAYSRRATCHTAMGAPALAVRDLEHAQWLDPTSTTLPHDMHKAMVVHVNSDHEWTEVVAQAKGRVIVTDYFATWCGPCKAIAPVVDQLSVGYSHMLFVKVDGDKCRAVVSQAGVRAFPTFQFYHNGTLLEKMEGADANSLLAAVQKHAGAATRATPVESLTGPPWPATH